MKTIIKYLMLTLLFSCSENRYFKVDRVKSFTINSEAEVLLEPTVVNIGLMGLNDISIFDSMLLIMGSSSIDLLSIVDTDTDSIILTTGSIGRGPNEYISPYISKHYTINANGDLITNVRDNLIRNRPLNITQTIKRGRVICEKDIVENTDSYTTLYINDDRRFTKTKMRTVGHDFKILAPSYSYIDKTFSIEFDIYPQLIKNSVEPISASYPYVGEFIRINPDDNKVVDFSYFLNRFVIFDLVNFNTLSVEEEGSLKVGDFKNLTREQMMPLASAHYIDAHLTNDYIIALYDGRSFYDMEDRDYVFEPTIRVFNWDGELVKQYRVKECISRIAYCENNNYLYAIDIADRLLKYKLDLL